jgi:signal transduction histidine kinase
MQKKNVVLKTQKDEIEAQSEELLATMEELHNTNHELEKVNTTKDKFFSIIAHDLKNPFHAISGFSSLLKKSFDDLDDEKKKEFISMIESSSKSASALLENLLTWSRSQTNRIRFEPENIALQKIIENTFGLMEVTANKKNIALINTVSDTETAYADANMITTVIRNLISNALKFTNQGGSITVSAHKKGNETIISVADTGIGMPDHVAKKIFRIESQHTTDGTSGESGTGLGLIICNEFVEKNNGKIKVESQEGEGSKFIIHLPYNNPSN